jgi:hypothetical protein
MKKLMQLFLELELENSKVGHFIGQLITFKNSSERLSKISLWPSGPFWPYFHQG